ncbi:MAG: hypothetical protein NTV94_18895, partial [Planctomycetota bacterium]|nr:hypothetical protein [Planctomycetota bacterium]
PPPPPPKSPDPIDIKPVLQSAKPDARVHFGQAYAPTDESLAKAIIALADTLAKGDAAKLGGMLTSDAKADLDALTSSGGWEAGTSKIEAVRVVGFNDLTAGGPGGGPGGSGASTGATIQLAVQDPSGAYLLGWEAVKDADHWKFKGVEAPAGEKRRASEFDREAGGETATAGTAAPAAAPAAAAKASDPIVQGKIALYVYTECGRRIADAGGKAPDTAAIAAMTAQFAQGATGNLADEGKTALKGGTALADEFYAPLFVALQALKGSSVTDDQVLQFMSNVTGVAERTVRQKATGKVPGTAPPVTPKSRGG